ncbi:MAG: hypothetical protein J6K12_02595, partial [Clostridia bacterium]|nr:hypothetical protein [Clostridia bacterium]
VEYASNLISKEANPEATIIWGAAFDTNLEDEMKVTVIATGFEPEKKQFDVRVARPVVGDVRDEQPVGAAVSEAGAQQEGANSNELDDALEFFKKPRTNTGNRFTF